MLESFCFLVHAIPWISQRFGEIRLDHAMTAQSAQSRASSALGELDAVISLVGKKALIRQPPHHPAYGCRRQRETLSNLVCRSSARSFADRVDRLQIVLDGRGERLPCPTRRFPRPASRFPHSAHATGLGASWFASGLPRTISTGSIEMCRSSLATLPRNTSDNPR